MIHHSDAPTVNLSTDTHEKRPDSTMYRVRGIPPGAGESTTLQLLEIVLDIDESASGLVIGSLVGSPNYSYEAAALSFPSWVAFPIIHCQAKCRMEIFYPKIRLSLLYSTKVQGSAFPTSGVDVVVSDCHFLGIPLLRSFAEDHKHEVESVLNLTSQFKIASV